MKTAIFVIFISNQCSGSGCVSGSSDLQDANKKKFLLVLMLIPFWRYIYIILQRSQNSSFCSWLMVESGAGSGSVQIKTDTDADIGGPKTYGSYGSGCGFGSGCNITRLSLEMESLIWTGFSGWPRAVHQQAGRGWLYSRGGCAAPFGPAALSEVDFVRVKYAFKPDKLTVTPLSHFFYKIFFLVWIL